MTAQTLTSPIAWYRRPKPSAAEFRFEERLAQALETLRDAAEMAPCVFAHSLSAEDMVIFHLIAAHDLPIQAIALDTGKLPEATVALWNRAEAVYSRRIERILPFVSDVAALVNERSDSAIYESKSARVRCCELRKATPLRTALSGKRAWVTGLRRAQSAGRAEVPLHEYDHSFQLDKFSPLANWADNDIWHFIDKHSIPYSPLYELGYASIGCDPCTRRIRANEHPRAGRWWWEQTDQQISSECGIHVAARANNVTEHKDSP
jgi:phosphoadenosine phosphosulfate reductase